MLVATLEGDVADLRRRLDDATTAQSELRRLLGNRDLEVQRLQDQVQRMLPAPVERGAPPPLPSAPATNQGVQPPVRRPRAPWLLEAEVRRWWARTRPFGGGA